jgi:alkaline phosphatase D
MTYLRRSFTLCLLSFACLCDAHPEHAISRIAFGSCAGQDMEQPIWEAVHETNPELWIWAGDNIYGDTEDMELFAEKWQMLLDKPGYEELRQRGIPILGTWDDHDYGGKRCRGRVSEEARIATPLS